MSGLIFRRDGMKRSSSGVARLTVVESQSDRDVRSGDRFFVDEGIECDDEDKLL